MAKEELQARAVELTVEKKAENKVSRKDVEIGTTGLIEYGGYVGEEWLAELRGRQGMRNYREMQDMDSTIGASLYLIKTFLKIAPWTAKPADESDEAKEWAAFLTECIGDMQGTWPNFISEASSMFTFGWSAHEKVYKRRLGYRPPHSPVPSSDYDDGRIGWKKISIRAQETLDRWQFDDAGREFIGFYQLAAPLWRDTFIPISKCVHFRTETDKNNPEGRSMLRNAFRSYFYLKRFQELEGVGAERDATGMVVMEVPYEYLLSNASAEKKSLLAKFKKMLSSMKRNQNEGVIVPSELSDKNMPTGFKLRLLTSGGSRQFDFDKVISRYQRNIAQTISTQFIFLGMNSVGSFALSSDQTNVFAQTLGALLNNIEDTFNRQAVEELMRLNGAPRELWPRWEHGDIESVNSEALIRTLKMAVDSGLINPSMPLEREIMSMLNMPFNEDEALEFDNTEAIVSERDPQDVANESMETEEEISKDFGGTPFDLVAGQGVNTLIVGV